MQFNGGYKLMNPAWDYKCATPTSVNLYAVCLFLFAETALLCRAGCLQPRGCRSSVGATMSDSVCQFLTHFPQRTLESMTVA